jgi:hypothetical protein
MGPDKVRRFGGNGVFTEMDRLTKRRGTRQNASGDFLARVARDG